MKYGVNRQILLITAGAVWIIAGANILRIGIVTWLNTSQDWMFKIGEATVVFLLFFVLVFRRLYYKHTQRIEQKKERRNCPFSFFDVKSWITMIFMISLGITIRSFHLLPETFISVFYTGLSIALILTGVLFIPSCIILFNFSFDIVNQLEDSIVNTYFFAFSLYLVV